MNHQQKIVWLDVLRVLAMLLVVIGHGFYFGGHTNFGSYDFPNEQGIYNLPYRAFTLLVAFIYTFHMPLFMALSGACFALTFGRRSFREVIKNKARRLLVPFLVTAVFISIPIRVFLGYYEDSGNNLLLIFTHHIICPIQIHLWFLLSLFIIFPLFYCIRPLHDRHRIIFWSILIVLSWIGNISEWPLQGFLGIPMALKHLFYFSVGFYSIPYLIRHNPDYRLLALSFIFQIIAFVLWVKVLEPTGCSYYFCIILGLWGSYNTTALCILLARWNYLINNKIYKILLKYNFQIYLYHDPFNYLYLMLIFSIGFIDTFGNPIHTTIITVLRIVLGIAIAIVLARSIDIVRTHIKPQIAPR